MSHLTDSRNTALVWFRRDLRTRDHAALSAALRDYARVWCVFVFDRDILDALPDRADRRVEFIHDSVAEVDAELQKAGGALQVRVGQASRIIPELARSLGVDAVLANHDDEPASLARDARVREALEADGRQWRSFKDHVVFERDEVLTGAGRPFSVFTPYKRAWLARLALRAEADLAEHPVDLNSGRLAPGQPGDGLPALESLGFERTNLRALNIVPGEASGLRLLEEFRDRMGAYGQARDFPAVRGPSYLSVHLRFGTVSIRQAARCAREVGITRPQDAEGAGVWLSELIWRDFYAQILAHHPRVVTEAFRPAYDRITWESGPRAEARLAAWQQGRTGFPLVDAAQRQLLQSGYMHNRLRMVSASFLVKDLGLDWRLGEAWFARHLNDFDLASNNGGWQWAASSGCDAQPWFRIFNPVTQSERFDAQGRFIRRYVPELAGLDDRLIHAPWLHAGRLFASATAGYPAPVVDHEAARRQTLARYEVVRDPSDPK